jgi:iron complex outermembrane recepter protein
MGSRAFLPLLFALSIAALPGVRTAAAVQAPPVSSLPPQPVAPATPGAPSPPTQPHAISGRVTAGHSTAALPGVTVALEETNQVVVSDADGSYHFDDVPPGTYHLKVTLESFTPARLEARVAAGVGTRVDISLEPELHYAEVVSVGVKPRDPFEAYQATSVLSGQELAVKTEASLGELLKTEPGVSQRSLGPAPSRPVIRGLDGDRVLILENGQRTDDLSSQSADHGVTVNPLAATRVEVVRGPATLLYGANAIGGLVNVVSEIIPTTPSAKPTGAAQLELGSGSQEAGASADYATGNGRWAFNAGGSARRSGDVSTPIGEIANTQARSAIGHIGASWTPDRGFLGASYQYDDSKYGVPVVEGGTVSLTPRRHAFGIRGQTRGLDGLFTAVKGSVNVRRYQHDELEGTEVGTTFSNDTVDGELLATTKPIAGRLEGTYGVSGGSRTFDAVGEEALSPRVDHSTASAFTYQEAVWPHVTLQFGGRVEHQAFTPAGGLRPRDFTNVSGSLGALFRPTEATTVAVSVARAVRNPALEELYFFGPHAGNFAFEVGSDDLGAERALGLDVAFRWRLKHVSGEVAYFHNAVGDFIFRQPTGETIEDFPVIAFTAADVVLQGVEAHSDVEIGPRVVLELGADYVRGELTASGEPLPRMPPLRATIGARYRLNALQLGAQLVVTADQDRVFETETPTAGAGVVKLYGAYSKQTKAGLHTITLRLDNATDAIYRNHLSYIKDLVPEAGRSVKLVYGVKF